MADSIDPSAMGKKGGRARADKLTPAERSAIARTGARARWKMGDPLEALLEADIVIKGSAEGAAEIRIPCAMLNDGTRVLSQRGLSDAMGGAKPMGRSRRGAGELPAILSAENIKPYITSELTATAKPLEYTPIHGGRTAVGIKAEALPHILRAWASADDAGVLRFNQKHIAVKAKILIHGLAGVGIVALVDEATGFQKYREQNALATILERFVAEELQAWVKTFPLEFYELICAVRGEPLTRAYKRPAYFGKITNELIYERLAPGVLEELRRRNPADDRGRRKTKHFQLLTPDLGHPKLRELLSDVIMVLRIAKLQRMGWDIFMKTLSAVRPRRTAGETLFGTDEADEDEQGLTNGDSPQATPAEPV